MEICAYALTAGRVLHSFQRRKRKKAGSSTRLFGRALTLANIVVVAMLSADLGIVSAQKRENALCVGHYFMLTGAPPSKLLFLLAPPKYNSQVQC